MLRRELEKQKKLDQEQQEFFAAASHELKTPVTVLKGQLTGMLYQVGAYQDRDLYLKKSLKTVEEMESRILKILEVSRMERADRKAEIRKLELSKILRESYEPYEDLIEDKGLRLQVSLPDSFKVLGDPKLLKSALENILENAVKYSPPGEEGSSANIRKSNIPCTLTLRLINLYYSGHTWYALPSSTCCLSPQQIRLIMDWQRNFRQHQDLFPGLPQNERVPSCLIFYNGQ